MDSDELSFGLQRARACCLDASAEVVRLAAEWFRRHLPLQTAPDR